MFLNTHTLSSLSLSPYRLGRLLEGDRILSINDESLSDVSLDHASKLIKEADDTLNMEIEFDVVGKRERKREEDY